MSTLSYHFAEFAIGAARARARRYHLSARPFPLSAGRASILRSYASMASIPPPDGFFRDRHKPG